MRFQIRFDLITLTPYLRPVTSRKAKQIGAKRDRIPRREILFQIFTAIITVRYYKINFDLQPKYVCEHIKCYNPYSNMIFRVFQ